MYKILISACLLGNPVRYDLKNQMIQDLFIKDCLNKGRLISVCPEVSGGLKTPRDPAEIIHGNGEDVLNGSARVITCRGKDVTDAFIKGAYHTLKMARFGGACMAILKEKSPSCGCRQIYDGSFSGNLVPGNGVTTALLEKNRIKVFSENRINDSLKFLLVSGSS